MLSRGFTLVEMAIGLAIFGVLLALALPNFTIFLQNSQIKNAAETTLSGLTLAKNDAIRRNATVRFQLMSDLTASCAGSTTALNWVVSLDDAAGLCDIAPHDTNAPRMIQVKSAQEGSRNVTVTTVGGSLLVFNSLGRPTTAGITQIDLKNPTGGACEHEDANGTMRCLRVQVTTGGAIKLCDPKVTAATDPRRCT
ncbi:MAG: GspH/FimT family pseudopilin [Betaproteobacteria bacterium]